MRASKRKCPSIPTEFEKFERLLVRYGKAGKILFGKKCKHFLEVARLRQELMLMYRRNMGYLSPAAIAGLIWDIITDAAQFFYTFPSEAEFLADPQQEMPKSRLAVRRSLLSANIHTPAVDTPATWLPRAAYTPTITKGKGKYGYTNYLGDEEKSDGPSRKGGGGGGGAGGHGGGDRGKGGQGFQKEKRQLSENEENPNQSHDYSSADVVNTDVHPIIMTMMRPILENNIPFRLNTLCKNSGLKDLRALPRAHNQCYRWMLGRCEGQANDPSCCNIRRGNSHPSSSEVPDDTARQLVQMLQKGVDVAVSTYQGKRQKM